MVIGIDHSHTKNGVGLRGLYQHIKGLSFLATKGATWLWFGIVTGIQHPYSHNCKYALNVEVCEPLGSSYLNMMGLFFFFLSNQDNYSALLLYCDRSVPCTRLKW